MFPADVHSTLATHAAKIESLERRSEEFGKKLDRLLYLVIATLGGVVAQLFRAH